MVWEGPAKVPGTAALAIPGGFAYFESVDIGTTIVHMRLLPSIVSVLTAALVCRGLADSPAPLTKATYEKDAPRKGVVLFDVNWGRKWNCGGFENAELRRLEFDRLPAAKSGDTDRSDFIVEGPARLLAKPTFLNYGFVLPAGEYALSGVSIKVARSVSDVGYFNAKRSDLIKNGKPEGGSFTVAEGEIIFIGNFFLDCQQQPMLWRYYPDGAASFTKQVSEYTRKFPFLRPDQIRFRLFRSKQFGLDYELPTSSSPPASN